MNRFVAAAVQLTSTEDKARNLRVALRLADEAVLAGATFVAFPENVDQIAPRARRLADAETLEGPTIAAFRQKAADRRIWILAGSFAERIDATHVHNTSVLIGPGGFLAAVYRKLHLFDANPSDGVAYRESESVRPGRELVVHDGPARLGLSVCYDLRFPELYRRLASLGAELLCVPSAFTVPTGEAHWEVLLRARAIENLAFVVAPAQAGDHGHGRRTWGHAMIVSPWGEVLDSCDGAGEGFARATLEPDTLENARAMLPALAHRRLT